MRNLLRAALAAACLTLPVAAAAAPDVPEPVRLAVQEAMRHHVTENLTGGTYVVYDTLAGGFRHLTFRELHPGVVTIGGYYVSCLDFVDEKGVPYDVDFMVSKGDHGYRVVQDLIHAVDGQTRAYHRER
jgi:hypothetical protein